MGEEVEELVKRELEAWARRQCAMNGIIADADWRGGDDETPKLDVHVRPEDAPNWRHHYAIPVERFLRRLAEQGIRLSRANGEKAIDG